MIGLWNTKDFVQHKFESDRIEASSKIVWFPVSVASRMDYVVKLTRSTMQLNDSQFSIGSLTAEDETGFII